MKNGSVELIEVKTHKKHSGRITRQKQHMSELVNFFNTDIKEYDDKTVKIIRSSIKQKHI